MSSKASASGQTDEFQVDSLTVRRGLDNCRVGCPADRRPADRRPVSGASRLMRISLIVASLLFVVPFGVHATPDSTALKHVELDLVEGGCNSNCSLVMDYGSVRFWYYVDGEGNTYLDYREELSGKKQRETYLEPLIYSHIPPVATEFAKVGAGPDGCGSDGWGWGGGENITTINYGMFSLVTNYSHAGQAVRVTVDNETGRIIGNPTSVASGIKAGTPKRCKLTRDEVQEK